MFIAENVFVQEQLELVSHFIEYSLSLLISGHGQEGAGGALLQDCHETSPDRMPFHQENR